MKTETKQKLFNHMSDEHSLTLLESEMFEIENILKPDWMEIVEAAFIAGRSKTSWEQFKKDNDLQNPEIFYAKLDPSVIALILITPMCAARSQPNDSGK